jgi:hypothetical protein
MLSPRTHEWHRRTRPSGYFFFLPWPVLFEQFSNLSRHPHFFIFFTPPFDHLLQAAFCDLLAVFSHGQFLAVTNRFGRWPEVIGRYLTQPREL